MLRSFTLPSPFPLTTLARPRSGPYTFVETVFPRTSWEPAIAKNPQTSELVVMFFGNITVRVTQKINGVFFYFSFHNQTEHLSVLCLSVLCPSVLCMPVLCLALLYLVLLLSVLCLFCTVPLCTVLLEKVRLVCCDSLCRTVAMYADATIPMALAHGHLLTRVLAFEGSTATRWVG